MTQLSEYEWAVQRLIDMGVPRARAEITVRRDLPHLASAPELNDRGLERDEQIAIRKMAIAYGFTVDNLSQYRPSKIAVGFPDLFLRHKTLSITLFWETKSSTGKRTNPQVEFGDDMVRCSHGYGHGDRYAFVEKLIELELAVRGAGPYGIIPIRDAVGAAPGSIP